jgi:hypothetical protein
VAVKFQTHAVSNPGVVDKTPVAPPNPDTPDSKIERWNALKAHLSAQTKAFADYCAPFKTEQDEIEAWLHNFLLTTKQNSAKTDHGTCYLSTLTQPKITDRTAYLDWALEHWDEGGNEMLQIAAPQVGAFEAYMEARKKELEAHAANTGVLPPDASTTPPGTTVSFFTRLNIRKG